MKLRPHSIDFLPLDFNANRDKRPLHQVYTKTGATTAGAIRFNSLQQAFNKPMGATQTAKLLRSNPKTDKKIARPAYYIGCTALRKRSFQIP